jgi:hypothetical protein
MYGDHQSLMNVVSGSIQSQRTAINLSAVLPEQELGMFSGLAFNNEHPLLFHFVSPFVLSPTELAVVDFDGLVRITNFLRAAQHIF